MIKGVNFVLKCLMLKIRSSSNIKKENLGLVGVLSVLGMWQSLKYQCHIPTHLKPTSHKVFLLYYWNYEEISIKHLTQN